MTRTVSHVDYLGQEMYRVWFTNGTLKEMGSWESVEVADVS